MPFISITNIPSLRFLVKRSFLFLLDIKDTVIFLLSISVAYQFMMTHTR